MSRGFRLQSGRPGTRGTSAPVAGRVGGVVPGTGHNGAGVGKAPASNFTRGVGNPQIVRDGSGGGGHLAVTSNKVVSQRQPASGATHVLLMCNVTCLSYAAIHFIVSVVFCLTLNLEDAPIMY